MWIVRLALNRPYTFVVLAILILLLSPAVIFRTPTDIFPNIDIPVSREALLERSGQPGEDFFVGCGNLVAAASPPRYFVSRSSSCEANSHNNLTKNTQERHDHQNREENTKHISWPVPSAFRICPL